MRKKISQREARRLRKRVQVLQEAENARRRTWAQDYPGGVEIARTEWQTHEAIPTAVRTARKLGHAVVVMGADSTGLLRFIALPLESK